MVKSNTNKSNIKFGDRRIFFESKTAKPFPSPMGITYDTDTVIRGSAFIELEGKSVSISLPSMAEIIYHQAHKSLEKAAAIKNRAFKTTLTNKNYHLDNEELFYTYIQLFSLGILGLYSSIESMVYELYIRKNKERNTIVDGKELIFTEFTTLGFERKITSVAAQLSGKSNIYGTNLLDNAKDIKKLRTTIQHWNIERGEEYFINLPDEHPLKIFPKVDPLIISNNAREILDHYSLRA
jgi:hypothetical protein